MPKLLALFFLLFSFLQAQTGSLLPMPSLQVLDNNGMPIAGGTLTFYAAGTTTLQAACADVSCGSSLTNPLTLDSGGYAPAIYIGGLPYKVVAKDSNGATLWTTDNVSTPGVLAINSLIAQKGQPNGLATLDGTGAVTSTQLVYKADTNAITRPIVSKLGDTVSVTDYGADPTGVVDSAPAFNKAAAALSAKGGGTVLIPSGTFKLASKNFYVILPADNGSYGSPVGGTGGSVVATVAGGVVTGLNISNAGSNYPASTTMRLYIGDIYPFNSGQPGSGAIGRVTTSSSGQLASTILDFGGSGYTATPTVTIDAQGGDGVNITGTLSGGALGSLSIVSGGSGFPVSSVVGGRVAGVTCTTYPAWHGVTSSTGTITSTVIDTAGAGCTGTPVPAVSNSCGGAQCNNMPTEIQKVMGCAVKTPNYVNWEGSGSVGTTVTTAWDGATVDTNQLIAFCSLNNPGSSTFIKMSNFRINSFADFWGALSINHFTVDNMVLLGGIPFYSSIMDVSTTFRDIFSNASMGIACGGTWVSRRDEITPFADFCDTVSITNYTYQPGLFGAKETAIDQFFEANVWKSQHGPFTRSTLPYGQCYVTLAADPRITDSFYGNPAPVNSQVDCFRGLSGAAFTAKSRYGRLGFANNIHFLTNKVGRRWAVSGNFTGLIAEQIDCEQCGLTAPSSPAWTADPYLPPGSKQPAIVQVATGGTFQGNYFNSINDGGSVTQIIKAWSTGVDVTSFLEWHNIGNTAPVDVLLPSNQNAPITASQTFALNTVNTTTAPIIVANKTNGNPGAVIKFQNAVGDMAAVGGSSDGVSSYLNLQVASGIAGTLFTPFAVKYNDVQINATDTATSSANVNSSLLSLTSSYWNGTAAANDIWRIAAQLGGGSNPTSTLRLVHSAGSSGTQTVQVPALTATSVQIGTGNAVITNSSLIPVAGSTISAACTINSYMNMVINGSTYKIALCN
jgi:hypothetical protein